MVADESSLPIAAAQVADFVPVAQVALVRRAVADHRALHEVARLEWEPAAEDDVVTDAQVFRHA